MTTRDDELLGILAASVGPPPDAEPTWAEISQLHRVIDSGWSGRKPGRAPFWRIRRPLTAAVAGLVVLGGASAAAAASGAVMPQPVRVAARAVGLPLDSPELASARGLLARLRDDLADRPHDLSAIRTDAQAVRDRLGRLSADDRSHVEDEAAFLLAGADAALAPPAVALGSPPPGPSSNAVPTPTPGAPADPADDDHGGRSTPSAEQEHGGSGSGEHQAGDDGSGSAASPSGSGVSGPGPSGSSGSGGDDHTAATTRTDNSGHDSSDGGGSSDGGSSHDGGGSSGSDGGHSGPG